MCPKVILEGTRMTWETEIAFALNSHPRVVGPRKYRYHSLGGRRSHRRVAVGHRWHPGPRAGLYSS